MGVAGAMAAAVSNVVAKNNALSAQSRANRQTARNYVYSMNYSLQGLQQQQQDAFEASIEDLMKVRRLGSRQESSVTAAVNEGLAGGGRTAGLLKRSAETDTALTAQSVVSNYQRKTNEIDLNKEATVLNTKSSISSIQEVEKPSIFSTLVSLGTAYVGAKNTQETIDAMRTGALVKTTAVSPSVSYDFDYRPDYSSLIFGNSTFGSYKKFSFDNINPYTKNTFNGW